MELDKAFLISFWFIVSVLFSMSIWGGWAEKMYERNKESYWAWYWLRFFKIPLTRENCIRFTKRVSAFGFIALTLGTVFTLMLKN
jgi:hypothetical protein